MSEQLTLKGFPSCEIFRGSKLNITSLTSSADKRSSPLKQSTLSPAPKFSFVEAKKKIFVLAAQVPTGQEFTLLDVCGGLTPQQMVFLSHELIRKDFVEEITITLIEGVPYPLLRKL